jgi:hypothetical protein
LALAVRFDEAADFVMAAEQEKIKRAVRTRFEDEARLEARATFEKFVAPFTQSRAGMEMRLSPKLGPPR